MRLLSADEVQQFTKEVAGSFEKLQMALSRGKSKKRVFVAIIASLSCFVLVAIKTKSDEAQLQIYFQNQR